MARIFGLIIGLLFSAASFAAVTKQQAYQQCLSQEPLQVGNFGYWTCSNYRCVEYPQHNYYRAVKDCTGSGGEQNNNQDIGISWSWDIDGPQCESDTYFWHSSVPGTYTIGELICDGECELEATGFGLGNDQFVNYRFRTTGNTCSNDSNGPDPDPDPGPDLDPDPDSCREFFGFRICDNDPPFCFRSPAGNLLCPGRDGPNCQEDQSGGVCFGRDPPPNSDPKPPVNVCENTACLPFVPYFPGTGDDDDDDDGDDDEDDNSDCPLNDPECENDDDSGAPRASDSGCETQTPQCSDMGHVDCQILIRTHRTKCEVAHTNEMLEDFRDRTLREQRETNAKLKALKDTLITNHNNALTHHELQITRVVDETKAVKEAVDGVKTAVTDSGSSVRTAVTSQTTTLGNKLDGIKQSIDNLRPGGGVIAPGNGDVVAAIGQQTSDLIGDGHDPGDGASDGDLDALRVRTVGDGPIDSGVIDQRGFVQGGNCPHFPPMSIGGMSWELDSAFWCDFLSIVRAVMILLGAWWSVLILLGRA